MRSPQIWFSALAALSFTVGGIFMKQADGVRNLAATALFLSCFGLGAVSQSLAMRGAELGVTYILVLGLEAALAFAFGVVIFGEAMTLAKCGALLLIVTGIALLRA